MKKLYWILILFLVLSTLSYGCQNTQIAEASSIESSVGELVGTVSFDHTVFKTQQELIEFLKRNCTAKEVSGVAIQNFIKDDKINIYEPTFSPPDKFNLFSVEIWTYYCSYYYYTDELIAKSINNKTSFAKTTVPEASYESEAIIPNENEENEIISSMKTDFVFNEENMIIIHWCTQTSEDPLAWSIEHLSLKPLGNTEFYYNEHSQDGKSPAYGVYWAMDGHLCYAHIPAAYFNEEAVKEICSFKPITVPCP